MLCDVVICCRRRWAHAPMIHAASHFYHDKRVAWVSISMHASDPVATARYCRDLQTKANTFCIIRAPSQTQSQCIIIHLARNADKGGGVLMSIILPNLNHLFISLVPVLDSGSGFRFRFRFWISGFSIRPIHKLWHTPHILSLGSL